MYHAEKTRMPSLFLSIDVEKVFDRVHWWYMSVVLSKFGFQGPILSATLALYSVPMTQVYTFGFLSKPFYISNGTQQGCPLSPTIFNLMTEPLAVMIYSHPLITGFRFNSRSHVINLFADNIILMLTDPLNYLPQAHQILEILVQIHTTRSILPSPSY